MHCSYNGAFLRNCVVPGEIERDVIECHIRAHTHTRMHTPTPTHKKHTNMIYLYIYKYMRKEKRLLYPTIKN